MFSKHTEEIRSKASAFLFALPFAEIFEVYVCLCLLAALVALSETTNKIKVS